MGLIGTVIEEGTAVMSGRLAEGTVCPGESTCGRVCIPEALSNSPSVKQFPAGLCVKP